MYSILGLGLIISPMLTRLIKTRYLLFVFLCMIGEGFILSAISQSKFFWVAALLFGITAIFSGIGNTLVDTVAMETIPSKWHGMYFGLTSMISNTFIGISMLLTGTALEWYSPRLVGFFGGMLYIFAGIIFILWAIKYSLQEEKAKLLQT
ncbi:hypothetical protein UB32_00950 [Mesobacillus subterraneus]|uniref:Major facilitator superfamily (MFS) profile domain-containing protein n=1 Tax=Mesobacillus subterraneus TaxID=285983 RepID=A0A0D6ZDA7_9BACI|nr:hypothetical protein UB32_00950 [Mesobacillus subterraneus]